MEDSEGFYVGPATRGKSPTWATLDGLAVGEVAEFKIPLYMNHNAPRTCATKMSKATGRAFGVKVGVREGVRIVTIKRVK